MSVRMAMWISGRMPACGCRLPAGICGQARLARWGPRSPMGSAQNSPIRRARWSCSWATGAPDTISVRLIPPIATRCPVVIVILDDEKWSAIALPQRDAYGGEFEMDLPRRNWPQIAGAMGGFGALARTGPEIGEAMRAAVASGRPAVVQVPVRSVISPYMAAISG